MNKNINLVGVLLAAGKGLRAYPTTKFLPKPLFEVDGETLLLRNINILKNNFQVKEIIIVIGYLGQQIVDYVNNLSLDIKIKFVYQNNINGIANAIYLLKNDLKENNFITILADEYYHNANYDEFKKKINLNYSAITTFIKEKNPNIISKNFIGKFDEIKVLDLEEKPQNPQTNLMGVGTYYFTNKIFDYIEKTEPSKLRNEKEITDVISNMAKKTNVGFQILETKYFNISNRSDLISANYTMRSLNFHKKKKTLIIPAYNEEKSIKYVIEDFKDYNVFDEIIVIDNNSKDQTFEISKKLNVKVVKEKNQGYGNAIMRGFEESSGDIIFITEADGSFKGRDIEKFLIYMMESDMVIGTRTTRQMIEQGSNMDSITRWANVFFAKFIELLWWNSDPSVTPRFTDVGCTFRAVWKSSFDNIKDYLKSPGPEFSVEMMLALIDKRNRIIEIPISYFNRIGGESKHSMNYFAKAKTAFRMLIVTLKIRFFGLKKNNK
jgi:dTDP-glucose pyrophosphorylase